MLTVDNFINQTLIAGLNLNYNHGPINTFSFSVILRYNYHDSEIW